MDLFGVGAAELLVIGFFLLIVAGPKRSAEWARQAGEYLGQLRQLWQRMMDDLRNEMGDDANELLNTAQEIQRTATDFRQQTSPRNIAGQAIKMVESNTKPREFKPLTPANNDHAEATPETAPAATDNERYAAWLPSSQLRSTPQPESTAADASPSPSAESDDDSPSEASET